MKPVMCMVKDDPENGSYGDCVRACLASMLELESSEVPHFFADYSEEDVQRQNREMQEWFAERGLTLAFLGLPGGWSQTRFFEYMRKHYKDREYMLWADFGSGDHAVVCQGGEIVHNPAWYRTGLNCSHSSGYWIAVLIAKL